MTHSKNKPRIILHGGAGNIARDNLPPASYQAYRSALLSVLHSASALLSGPDATAMDVATYAVSLLEDIPLFNAGHGAVYTRHGRHELEASVMCSQGHRKRGVGVMLIDKVKNPIKLAREMLLRGDDEDGLGGGAAGHCQLAGETAEALAEKWGLDMVSPSYYWTKKRWDEHRRGIGKSTDDEVYKRHKKLADSCSGSESKFEGVEMQLTDDPSWNGKDYLPQGTVGCVVLDSSGTLCVATSTGGLTNKLDGRIGDTPTIGAGFFAEQWFDESPYQPSPSQMLYQPPIDSPMSKILGGNFSSVMKDCFPSLSSYTPLAPENHAEEDDLPVKALGLRHGVAMSGTGKLQVKMTRASVSHGPVGRIWKDVNRAVGNGDSFLRLSAVRTAAAVTRFSYPPTPLAQAVSIVAGPRGQLQQSAEDRWGKTGEGEGGIIGIEYYLGEGKVVADFNCGGMFRAWVDDQGKEQMKVFREEYA